MSMKKESSLHKKIKEYAESLGGYAIKIWGGGFQEAGIPDLIMCVNGNFIGMEVKIGDGTPSELQVDHVLSIAEANGIGCVVWTFEDAKRIIDYANGSGVDFDVMDHAQKMYDKYS